MSNFLFKKEDLINNPCTRLPICLCLDASGSMDAVEGECEMTGETVEVDGRTWNVVKNGTTRMNELQKGIELFYEELRKDDTAALSAEICIVSFGNSAKCELDFASLERQTDIPELKPNGATAMGEGVNLALDLLEQRKNEYRENGVDYYQPWLVLMTDGVPNGSPYEQGRAVSRIADLVNNKKLTVFPIAIGNESDLSALKEFSPKRSPIKLQGLKFSDFFAWLSRSVARTSQSMPGDCVKFDPITDWAEL